MDVPTGPGGPWSAYHGLVDSLGVQLGSMLTRPLFRDGVDAASFDDHLREVSVSLPASLEPGTHQVAADTRVGELDAGLTLTAPVDPGRPLVIYHHGFGELPVDSTFTRLFSPAADRLDATLAAVRAPFHGSPVSFDAGMGTLERFLAMLAVSVAIVEVARTRLVTVGGPPVVVTGTSLGGFVTNLHHIHYGTADRYVPLLAGLALDDVMLHSSLRRGVDRRARAQAELLTRRLNFESAFESTDPAGVHPILARFDQIVRYPVQTASYNGRPVATVDAGHLTATTTVDRLRSHLDRFISRAAADR